MSSQKRCSASRKPDDGVIGACGNTATSQAGACCNWLAKDCADEMDIADVSPPPVFWRQKNLYSRVSRSAKEKPLMLHAVLYQPSYKAGTEPAVYGF